MWLLGFKGVNLEKQQSFVVKLEATDLNEGDFHIIILYFLTIKIKKASLRFSKYNLMQFIFKSSSILPIYALCMSVKFLKRETL